MLCLGGRLEGIVGRLGILAAVALGRVRTALGFVEIGVALGAVHVAKRQFMCRLGRRPHASKAVCLRPRKCMYTDKRLF